MKKLLLLAAIAGFTFSCNSDSSKSSTGSTDTAAASTATATDSAAGAKPALKDGLMKLQDGKMMVVKANAWTTLDSAVTCTNGRKVDVNGEVTKGTKKRKLEDVMMIDKDGQITDKDGKPVDTSGWE
jgi:hypothetical protein